jgi:hypothetical protein
VKRIAVAALGGFVLIMAIGAFIERRVITCQFLPAFGYTQLQGRAFAAGDIAPEQFGHLEGLVASAAERIRLVYGEPESRPWILITGNASTASRWGANQTASMHRMPGRSCIIIGPDGQNVDVLAHEYLHAEIQDRVGFWRFLKEIPVWFDEGAALTLDYREPFLPENIDLSEDQVDSVQRLKKNRDFFSGNIRENYQAARMAVIPLINTETFFLDLERIGNGESFDSVFPDAVE